MIQTVQQSLTEGLATLMNFIPQIIGALVILIIGYIVAKILEAIAKRVLQGLGFEGWMERGGIKQFFERSQTRQTPLSIIGKLVFWLVFIVAITMAVEALGIQQISQVLSTFIAYIPQIIAAILIFILAALLANFLAGIVRGATGSNLLGSIAQYGIIVFAAFAALTQLGIAQELIVPTFLIALGAVALAAALAFGIGSQGVARELVEEAYSRRGEVKQEFEREGSSSSGRGGGSVGERAARTSGDTVRREEEQTRRRNR